MNYIKTKLKLDELLSGQVLEVFIDEGEAVRGIPMGLKDEGHEILLAEATNPGYRVVIRKGDRRQKTEDRRL